MSKSSEQPKTLMDLLTELRGEADPKLSENAYKMGAIEQWVAKNRSGLMSAMIKAVRMRKMNHALYFCALLLHGRQSKWYVSRRVAVMACEDGLDDTLMQYVMQLHVKKDNEKSFQDIMNGVVAICLRPTWWNTDYGKEMMFACFKEKKVEVTEGKTEDELEELFRHALFTLGGSEGFTLSSVVKGKLQEGFAWSTEDVHKWLIKEVTKREPAKWMADLVQAFKRMTPDITKAGDENWNYIFRYMICQGRNPDNIELPDLEAEVAKYAKVVDKILDIALKNLMEDNVVIPPWVFDGMHASSKNKYTWADKRFPGSLKGFYNCIKMAEKYGRLDPRDQGVLDGCEVPEEGLVLGNEFLEDITL